MRKSLKSLARKPETVAVIKGDSTPTEPALTERPLKIRPERAFKRRGIRVYSVRNRIRER